ncbi:hypothetical protein BLOT_007525 [Blomia tropicalis]|nr:hypothetical protein BLOT_007525 [Blomia tropicalis]
MTTVISTHLSHQINVQSKEVFDNFCQILVEMRNECDKKIFQPIIFDFRLCELFTIQVLFTTETLKEPSLMIEFYEPVLDLFNNEKVIFNLDTYLQMCDIMKWSYIICPYYWTRDSSVLDLVWKILNNNSNYTMQTIILLKQTIFWHEKLFGANFDHNKLNQVKIRIEKQITSQWIPNFQFNDTANELLFNIDEIIRRLFQNNFAEIVAEKSKYLELTSKANDFVFKSYILLDVYILWKGLLQYLDQQVEDGFSVSVISIKLDSTVGTYDLVMKLLYIYEEKGANLFKQSAKTENKFYLFVIRLWYSILINGIDKYYNFPAFQILNIYQLENGNLNCDKIKTLLKDDPFWSKLLQAYSSKLGFDEDYFNLFQIIQKLTSTPLDVNVMKILKRILNFTLNILIRTKLNEFEYFEKLFQMRCQIYGYGKLPIEGIEPMKSIIKETAFTKLKVDFNNANISKLSIDIISCAFWRLLIHTTIYSTQFLL